VAAPARIELDGDAARVVFDEPESALAPGQGAAFYAGEGGDRLIGGGWIAAAERPEPGDARAAARGERG
jgi:tRNA-specific 2-thiouridylase